MIEQAILDFISENAKINNSIELGKYNALLVHCTEIKLANEVKDQQNTELLENFETDLVI